VTVAAAQPIADHAECHALCPQAIEHVAHGLAGDQHLVDALAPDLVNRLVYQQFGRRPCAGPASPGQPEPGHETGASMRTIVQEFQHLQYARIDVVHQCSVEIEEHDGRAVRVVCQWISPLWSSVNRLA